MNSPAGYVREKTPESYQASRGTSRGEHAHSDREDFPRNDQDRGASVSQGGREGGLNSNRSGGRKGLQASRHKEEPARTPHDEAFKKLLQTFFAEFIALFFPELDKLLDYSHSRFLMQELLVDVVGEEKRTLDLLLETRYRGTGAYVLVHLEPNSYRDGDFHERMFIYFARMFERHRKEHSVIIPIAIFTADDARNEPDSLTMAVAEHALLHFRFLKVELRSCEWRRFVDSDNPVAAALLAKMGYTGKEKREVRFAYLRMLLRLSRKLDKARLALVMSVADLYFKPDAREDEVLMKELNKRYPEESAAMQELMPAWKRWGYEEGIEKGIQQGREQGIEQGKEQGLQAAALNMLRKSIDVVLIAEITGMSETDIEELKKRL
ncbi:Rpn family recombination-promoting nuclease/putative transposase [Paenibacillus hodogayensis]|uniref:Rpn family recombination-promoting nuclease/putative transposase n=1 Tax=Paenibacillus hodogayensis TaxID=279208 RepID=A0ABV5VTS6_9BACL